MNSTKPRGPAIRLVENRTEGGDLIRPHYDVLFRGQFFGQLRYERAGYVGVLPSPSRDGSGQVIRKFIGECGIAIYRREIAELNREWKRRS